nr:MAG TPA: hypothetical protein [Caudoviricetes sp.]
MFLVANVSWVYPAYQSFGTRITEVLLFNEGSLIGWSY